MGPGQGLKHEVGRLTVEQTELGKKWTMKGLVGNTNQEMQCLSESKDQNNSL